MFEILNGLTSGSESIGLSPWDALFKSTLVLGLAAIICRFLRRQSAALRHRVWVLGIVAALIVPWTGMLLPQISFAVLPGSNTQTLRTGAIEFDSSSPRTIQAPTGAASIDQNISSPPSLTTQSAANPALGGDQGNHQSSTSPTRNGAASLLVTLWLVGTAITAALFLVSLFRQSLQLRRLPAVDDLDWNAAVATAALSLGLHKTVPSVESNERCVPAVVGVLRPKLVVPREWRSWSAAQRHCILLHELAHVKRRDVATQLLGRIAWVTYWFHPLMWHAVRQLRIERELAADDCVLLSGQTASDYAEQLLRTLRSCRAHRMALGVAMAHSARLDERVRAILDPNRRRKPVGNRLGLVLLATVAAIGALLGGVKLVADEPGAESPTDSRPAEPPPEPKTMWRENFTIEFPGALPVSVDFSEDGETLLTGDTNGEVMALVFNGDDPQWRWKAQAGGKHAAVAYSADQKQVYATFKDGVRILDAKDGKEWAKIEVPDSNPTAIDVSPDQLITENTTQSSIIFGNPGEYVIWFRIPEKLADPLGMNNTDNTVDRILPAESGELRISVNPDGFVTMRAGTIDATGEAIEGNGKKVEWAYLRGEYRKGKPGNRLLTGHNAPVVCAGWSKGGNTAATGDTDGRVIFWDTATINRDTGAMKESRRLELGGRVLSLAVSSDGSQSAAWVAGDNGCELHLWETNNPPEVMNPIHTEVGDFDGPTAFADLDFSPDGKRLAGCAGDKKWLNRLGELVGKVHVWEVANEPRAQLPPKQVYTKSLPQGSSSNFVILNNHTLLAPASKAGAVDMRDIATGDIQARIVLGQFDVGRIKLSSDRKWLALVQSQRFDPNTTSPPSREFDVGVYQSVLQLKTTIPGCLQLLDIASGGKVIAVVREAGIEIWDIATTKVLQTAPFDHIRIDAAAISPDGKLLAISDRGTLVLWNWETNEFETIKLGRNLDSLTFSPDGKYLAEGPDSRKEIQIRDIATRQIVQSLDNGTELSMHVRSTAFSQGGRLLIGSDDITYIESITVPYRINLWDTTTGKIAHQLAYPPGELPYAVGVTPNGRYLVVSSEEWKTGAMKLSTWRLDSEIPPRDPGPKPPATTTDP